MVNVAVAVKSAEGKGSQRAFRWAIEKLLPKAHRLFLIHVMPTITAVPTPSGENIPVNELDDNVVEMYIQDMRAKCEDIFIPFKNLCKRKTVETVVLEGDNPATVLLKYVAQAGINSLVLGSSSPCYFGRRQKDGGVPSAILKHGPESFDVYVVSSKGVAKNSLNPLLSTEKEIELRTINQQESSASCTSIEFHGRASSLADFTHLNSQAFLHGNTSNLISPQQTYIPDLEEAAAGPEAVKSSHSSTYSEHSDIQVEMETLRLELQNTIMLYNQTCEHLIHAQNKLQLLSSEWREETRRVNATKEREERLRKTAAEVKKKHVETEKEVEIARKLLAKEACERQIAELKALQQSLEKQKVVNALLSCDRRYKRLTKEEIEVATDFFSESKIIGEGGYGKVYKGNLDHTPVAIKVLHPDASQKREEFLKEVEVLSQLHHPHIVLLLGASPENGCLVYEYMENGSLEDHISKNRPLPWFVRFRVLFEVACALAFLHNSKPEPIVHRDLKPGNILLDKNYVSKIGDVGLAKFMSDIVPESITEYRNSIIAGTFAYMDPEYLRTGTLRPKSDLYAFGIITLQLLAACHPNGLILKFEQAIDTNLLADVLDKSVVDWPLIEVEELTKVALQCCKLRCRDRPDLETEVLPLLKKLCEFAEMHVKVEGNLRAPSQYFCPILQEVMEDPHIAADGFTYEHRAIKAWVDRHNVSPVTKQRLQHKMLTPNHTLHLAIQDWRSR